MKTNIWQLQEAKSRFSKLVEIAMRHEPQIVTKHGTNAVVVLSYDDYNKMVEPSEDLVSFFGASPLVGLELDAERDKDLPREVEL